MAHKLENRSAKVLVIEGVSTRRSGMVEVVKSLGFRGVKAASTLQEGLHYIGESGETPDWIISSLFPDQPINILSFLKHVISTPSLRSCLVSLIHDKTQGWCLPKAFELGLFSCHLKTDDMAGTHESLRQLLARGDSWRWRNALVAASYLRELLQADNKQGDSSDHLLKLERSLLAVFPDEQEPLLVEIVNTLIASNKPRLALAVLHKAGTFSDRYRSKVDELSQRALAMQSSGVQDPASFAQSWEVGRCVLVDPDESGRNLVELALKEMGATDIVGYTNGEDALEGLKNQPEPDLIVQEWRLPKVSGDRFVQRVRLMGFRTVPIIVFSSLVKSSDRYLLREMGVSEVITKPLSQKKLMALVMQVIEEEKRPRGEKATELRIRKALHAQNLGAAKHLFEAHFAHGKGPQKIVTVLAAELAFAENRLAEAEGFATEALHINGEDTLILNLLGKINLKLKQHAKAERFFAKAEELCPGNVERLCQLAEVKAEQQDFSEADAMIEKARKIDAQAAPIQSALIKVAVLTSDQDRLKSVMGQLENQGEMVAFLNNRAVGLSAQGKTRDSVKLYHKALKSMPKSMHGYAPTILYNMALAMIKTGDLQKEAALSLKQALSMSPGGMAAKIKSLSERLDQAIAKNEPLMLKTLDPHEHKEGNIVSDDSDPEASGMLLLDPKDITPGDFCCYKIFESPQSNNPQVAALLKDREKPRAKAKDHGSSPKKAS